MKVKDMMTKNVITVSPEDSLFDVVKLFSEKKISGAPVVEANRLVGIVGESDIIKVIGKRNLLLISRKDLEKMKEKGLIQIKQVMKKKVIAVKPNNEVRKATALMNRYDVNRLPVVKGKKVVGIITRADIVNAFSKYLSTHPVFRKKPSLMLETNIDKLLQLVKEEEKIKISEAAKRFKIPPTKIEEWGRILEECDLIELHYPTIGSPLLKIKKESL